MYKYSMFTVTEKAKNYLIHTLENSNSQNIKLFVEGGGCAGFTYNYELTAEIDPTDFVVPLNEYNNFLIDGQSLMFVVGTSLDYITSIGGSSLKIVNPNEKSSCGCGKSFSV